MDATASREPTWDRASHLQAEMFKETEALGGLDVQLIYYRGFGECRASPWVSESAKLLRFMTGVFCLAGRTQIGKVLQRATKETRQRKVSALVFVGDAMEEEIGRASCREGGWHHVSISVFAVSLKKKTKTNYKTSYSYMTKQ